MCSQTTSSERFEALWADLRVLLRWHQGFALCFVYGDNDYNAQVLRQRIADQLGAPSLEYVRHERAADMVQQSLTAALRGVPSGGALWLALTPGPGDPDWERARRDTLAALNQRRAQLVEVCRRPLFIHLPLALAGDTVSHAPDLWSVRSYLAELPPERIDAAPGDVVPTRRLPEREIPADGAISVQQAQAAVDEQRRLLEREGRSAESLRSLAHSLQQLSEAQQQSGTLSAALLSLADSTQLLRERIALTGETPQALGELADSLTAEGRLRCEWGAELETAQHALKEAEAIRRRVCEQSPADLDARHAWAAVLHWMGWAEELQGRWQAAMRVYGQFHAISRHLAEAAPERVSYRRNWSVALDNLGRLEAAQGHWEAANAMYERAERIRSTLVESPPAIGNRH